ncbi:MAG: winged helix-turn-helix domain-containing protein [Nitrosopumilus sp.]|nr:winged helix-turn-helix domain-containing protein [Nitrosopumilus sp.]
MSDENNDEFTEKIKILATDDEKIKSFGELFTNDSSREILQLLFNEELTATQIAQKTNISLQLVKYHLIKLQDLGIVKISKIEKNSKSQDMKIYTATKFSIVIVPPKLSAKTKESKLLVRSFRHIYKVAGLGIATGISGLLSLSQFQNKTIYVGDSTDEEFSISESVESMRSAPIDESARSLPASAPMIAESESQEISKRSFDVAETLADSEISVNSDLFLPLLIITIILGGFTAYYFWKSRKSN